MNPTNHKRFKATTATRGLLCASLLVASYAWSDDSPGPPSSEPTHFTRFGDAVYFTADDGLHGRELWRTDGTPDGTRLVIDLTPGPAGTDFRGEHGFHATADALYFVTTPSRDALGVYATDGSAEGTRLLRQMQHLINERFEFLLSDGPLVYFNLLSSFEESGLWVSDGTDVGTRHVDSEGQPYLLNHGLIMDNGDAVFTSHTSTQLLLLAKGSDTLLPIDRADMPHGALVPPTVPAALGEEVIAASGHPAHGGELTAYHPQTGARRLVKDINPGNAGSSDGEDWFTPFQGGLAFRADDGVHGRELWFTDGTGDGTRMVADINPGAGGSDIYRVVVVNGVLVFIATTAEFGTELWGSDGTREGTRLLRDLNPGPPGSYPYAMCVAGNRLFFSCTHATLGEELWVTDGTPEGTRLVRDLVPGPGSAYPYYTTAIGDRVVFAATTPEHGRELWVSDGTPDGTRLLRDIYDAPRINPSAAPIQITPAGGQAYFVANDLDHGAELWITDGTEAGTRMVRDIFPGPASSNPKHLVHNPARGLLFFAADDGRHGVELWQSDGTEAGTFQVTDIAFAAEHGNPTDLLADELGHLYFVAMHGDHRARAIFIHRANGSTDVFVHSDKDTPTWNPRDLVLVGEMLYFVADDGIHGEELWSLHRSRLDSLRMVRDIALPPNVASAPVGLTPWNGRLLFSADDTVHGRGLWRAEGDPPMASPLPRAETSPQP